MKFMSYVNQKLRPSYRTVLNLCLKAGFPLVDFFHTKRLFSWRKFLMMENIKNTPEIKSEAVVEGK